MVDGPTLCGAEFELQGSSAVKIMLEWKNCRQHVYGDFICMAWHPAK